MTKILEIIQHGSLTMAALLAIVWFGAHMAMGHIDPLLGTGLTLLTAAAVRKELRVARREILGEEEGGERG